MGDHEAPDVADAKARKRAPSKRVPARSGPDTPDTGSDFQNQKGNAAVAQSIAVRVPAPDVGSAPMTSSIDEDEVPAEGGVSEASETAQHLQRQYPHLFEMLPLTEWQRLVAAAEARAERQEQQQSVVPAVPYAIDVPLEALLTPDARFIDVDIWTPVFETLHRGDEGPTAGILLRNEIARSWFTRNAIDPRTDVVTVALIDPDGLVAGPAQLEFTWRHKSVTDVMGALDLAWLQETFGDELMVQPLRSAVGDVSHDAYYLGEAAWLLRTREAIEPKLPEVLERSRVYKNAILNEVEAYQELTAECADRAFALERAVMMAGGPHATSYAPGLASFFQGHASTLFTLATEIRDWRVGKEVNGQRHDLDDAEVIELLTGDSPYARGEMSWQGQQDLRQAELDRALIMTFVSVALTFATLGVGAAAAGAIGLTEGTVAFTAVQMGTSFALTDVGTMAAGQIYTAARHLDDPVAQATLEAGADYSVGDYFKAAGLGFLKGATLAVVLGGSIRGIQAYRSWRAARTAVSAATAIEPVPILTLTAPPSEPPFVVLSDTMDVATGVRTWQLRTRQGEFVTIAAHETTGSGYIYHSGTGEIRQIVNGQLEGAVQMLGEGAPGFSMSLRPQPLALAEGGAHAQALAELDQLTAAGPLAPAAPNPALPGAVDAFARGMAQADDFSVVLREVVEDFRALRRVRALQSTQGTGDLTYRTLKDCCGLGRDVTAASLSTHLSGTGQSFTMFRFQALDVFERLGEQHAFSVVWFPGLEDPYLIDATFAQFFRPGMFGRGGSLFPLTSRPPFIGPEGLYTGNVLREDLAGTTFARDLARDGFVQLTPVNARQYVRAMGVPERDVERLWPRLRTGEGALLEETVAPGRQPALISLAPEDSPPFLELRYVEEEVNDMIALAQRNNDPLGQLPRLLEFRARLEEAHLLPVEWSRAIHSPQVVAEPDPLANFQP